MASLLLLLHLTRENEPEVPIFQLAGRVLTFGAKLIAKYGVVSKKPI